MKPSLYILSCSSWPGLGQYDAGVRRFRPNRPLLLFPSSFAILTKPSSEYEPLIKHSLPFDFRVHFWPRHLVELYNFQLFKCSPNCNIINKGNLIHCMNFPLYACSFCCCPSPSQGMATYRSILFNNPLLLSVFATSIECIRINCPLYTCCNPSYDAAVLVHV